MLHLRQSAPPGIIHECHALDSSEQASRFGIGPATYTLTTELVARLEAISLSMSANKLPRSARVGCKSRGASRTGTTAAEESRVCARAERALASVATLAEAKKSRREEADLSGCIKLPPMGFPWNPRRTKPS
jgi:hypothetical protein